ncbi:hypothetical protein [Microbulbifer sp. GL-2]|uniref:hypothetical protein n=1 Tax=Microbulbifer sp. GL-2 TaxID=2591606 RepID=UPI001161D2E2|nr:hypothetical protein [Microbulbifer sp. GL-2]BBM03551.1 hypothetical protein GL2_36250 [Microbulbifer sp. GL-2]
MYKILFYIFLYLASQDGLAKEFIEPLSPGEGYAVLALVISGEVPKSVKIQTPKLFGKSYLFEDLSDGNNFKIIRLPAGEYRWTKVTTNRNSYYKIKEKEFNLNIQEGSINYGGHLTINTNWQFETAEFDYINRTSQTIEELEKCCLTLLNEYPLLFTERAKDPFIKFYFDSIQSRQTK